MRITFAQVQEFIAKAVRNGEPAPDTLITVLEVADQDGQYYVRATDAQNGQVLWVTEVYDNYSNATRAARGLVKRHRGGALWVR